MFPLCSSLPGLFRRMRCAATLGLALALLGSCLGFAHEGHDHADASTLLLASSTWPRVVAQSELYQIVGILKGERLSIYLEHAATNEPIKAASVMVTIGDAQPVLAEPAPDGTYALTFPRLSERKSIEIVFSVNAPSGDDLLVGSLAFSGPAPASGATSSSKASWLAWTASIPVALRNPLLLTILTFSLGILFGELARRRRLVPALTAGVATTGVLLVLLATASGHEDHAHGDTPRRAEGAPMSDAPRRLADGSVFIAKPTQRLLEVRTTLAKSETVHRAVNLIGRVMADPSRTSLVQSVYGGRVVALEGDFPRIGQVVKKGDALVRLDPHLPLADRTTIAEKAGEIEQLIAMAEAKLRRLRPLAERGVTPQSQVIDAEAELDGLRRRREVVHSTRVQPEILHAPTDGVIALAKVVPGQVVMAQDIMFQIVDPKGFWVEALVYGEADPAALTAATTAWGGHSVRLVYQGFSRALQQHATVVHFSVPEPPDNLSVGQALTVIAKSGTPITALLVPRDAVVRNASGEAIVWQHVEPERFEPRPVRTQPFDATRVVVAAGLQEGDRIVIRAADLVNQIR